MFIQYIQYYIQNLTSVYLEAHVSHVEHRKDTQTYRDYVVAESLKEIRLIDLKNCG